MTTLAKRKNKNRLLSRFNNDPFWNSSLFPSNLNEIQNLFKFNDVFNGDFFEEDSLMPSMNVKENKDNFEIELAVPGFEKKDFEVSIDGNVLNISGEKSKKEEEDEENYTCKEFSYKSFKRSSTLPESVDLSQEVKASYKDGILQIGLAKKEDTKKVASKKVVKIS